MKADLGSIEVVEVVARALYILRRHLHALGGATLLHMAVSQAVVVGTWLFLQPRSPNLLPTALVFANSIGIVVTVTLGFLYMGLMAQLLASIHFDHPVGLVDGVRSLIRHGKWLLMAGLAMGAAACALCLPLSRYLAEVSLRQIGGSPPPMDTGILLAYAGLVVGLFFCFFRLSFFFPSVVLEENGPFEALQRSNDVSRGHESKLLAVGLASALLSSLANRIVTSILSQWFAPTVVELAMLLLGALIYLLPLVAFYELYFEIMLRRADFLIPRFIDDLASEGEGSAQARAQARAATPTVDSLTEARIRFREALKASQASATAGSLLAREEGVGPAVAAVDPCPPMLFEAPACGTLASRSDAEEEAPAAKQAVASVDEMVPEGGRDVDGAGSANTDAWPGEVSEAAAPPDVALLEETVVTYLEAVTPAIEEPAVSPEEVAVAVEEPAVSPEEVAVAVEEPAVSPEERGMLVERVAEKGGQAGSVGGVEERATPVEMPIGGLVAGHGDEGPATVVEGGAASALDGESLAARAAAVLGLPAMAPPGLLDAMWPPLPPPPVAEEACTGGGEGPDAPLRGLAALLAALLAKDGRGFPGGLPRVEVALAPALSRLDPWVEGMLDSVSSECGSGAVEKSQEKPTTAGVVGLPIPEAPGEALSASEGEAAPGPSSPVEMAGMEQPGAEPARGADGAEGAVFGEHTDHEEPAPVPAGAEPHGPESAAQGEFGLPWHLPADWFAPPPDAMAWRHAVTEGEAFLLSRTQG